MKKYIIKFGKRSFSHYQKVYRKILPYFLKVKATTNKLDFAEFKIKFSKHDVLEFPCPKQHKLNPRYVFIKSLQFHPEIKINRMKDFKSLLKWNVLNLKQTMTLRNYPLGFSSKLKSFDRPELALKVPPKVLKIESKNFYIHGRIRTNEEIVRILPYERKMSNKKLIRIPIRKRPVYKHHFSRDEIKLFREKAAQQNNTSWVNIQIFEIYDKFYANLYSNVRQAPGSKDLECNFNFLARSKNPEKFFYLVIGQRRDTGQSIKAIVEPADIKKHNSG